MNHDLASMSGNPFTTISQKNVYHTPWIDVREDEIIHPDGAPGTYSVVELPGFSLVLPITKHKKIWMVKLWRYPIEQFSWELPMGRIDAGETPLQTAQRELIEETGFHADLWQDLGSISSMAGVTNCRGHVFVAPGLTGAAKPQDREISQAQIFSLSEVEDLIQSGQLHDTQTLAALWKARMRRLI